MPKTVPITQTSPSFLLEAQAVQLSRMIHQGKVAVWSCGIALGTCICLSTLGTVVSLFPPESFWNPVLGIHLVFMLGVRGVGLLVVGCDLVIQTLDQALYSGTGTGKVHNGH